MTKKQRQQFLTKAKELLLSLGAKQDGGEAYRFTIQTKADCIAELICFNTPRNPISPGLHPAPSEHLDSWLTRYACSPHLSAGTRATRKPRK